MNVMRHKLARFFSSEYRSVGMRTFRRDPSPASKADLRPLRAPHGGVRRLTANSGFTLIEMIVAVGLFAVVMVICVGALLSLVHANRKAQALQSVMNNLNIALDGMVRSVRMGNDYNGSSVGCAAPDGNDCPTGSTRLVFHPYCDTDTCNPSDTRAYYFEGGSIKRSINGSEGVAITAPEVSIDEMLFHVVGSDRTDARQPKVVIVVKGSAGASGTAARTTFHIQATAVQRVLDL